MEITRLTTTGLNNRILNSLYSNMSKMSELQEQVASGKRVSTLSDDAGAAIDILTADTNLDKIEVYLDNIDYAISETDMVDQALSDVTSTIQRANELAVQAANATSGSDELANIKEEIDQLIGSLVDLGNTQFGDVYLFSGTKTQTAPFSYTEGVEVEYNGSLNTEDYKRETEISKNITISSNLCGEDIFGYYDETAAGPPPVINGKGLFNTLMTLSNNLTQDPADYDAIRDSISDLDDDLDTVLNARAKVGGVSTRLELTQNKLENDKLNYTQFKSNAEDIDLSEAITDLTMQETALNAAMSVSGTLLGVSLINYL